MIRITDVWADWCAPCKKFAPIFHALSEIHKDIEFVSVDIDKDHTPLKKYNIRGIPAIIFEKDGLVVRTHIGILTRGEMEDQIAQLRYSSV